MWQECNRHRPNEKQLFNNNVFFLERRIHRMFKWSKGYFVVFVVLVVLLLTGAVGTGFVFVRGTAKASTSATATDEVINLPVSAKPISERAVAMHTVDETKVPKA